MKQVVGVNGVYVPLQMELVERGAFRLTKANGRVDRVQLKWLLHIMRMRLVIRTGHKRYL